MSMSLCSDGHAEVAYATHTAKWGGRAEQNECPACVLVASHKEAIGERDEAKDKLQDAEEKVEELTTRIAELEAEIAAVAS